jgi:hypothetical protein
MRATFAFDSLRQFKNICTLRTLAEKMRIMATMPQFPRLRTKQTAKKDSRQINEMAPHAGIS